VFPLCRFPFTANTAARTSPDARSTRPEGNGTGGAARKNPEPARTDSSRAARILKDAERTARTITYESGKAEALARIAGALAATDPDRADPDRAERIARTITNAHVKASALVNMAAA